MPQPAQEFSRRPRRSSAAVPVRRAPLHQRPLVIAASSAGIGFVCGALFWHLIGFWSFVSEVVLRGGDNDIQRDVAALQQARASAAVTVPAHLRATGSISPVRPTATRKGPVTCSIAVPVADGETDVQPCPAGTPTAPTTPLARKSAKLDIVDAGPAPAATTAVRVELPAWAPVIRGQVR